MKIHKVASGRLYKGSDIFFPRVESGYQPPKLLNALPGGRDYWKPSATSPDCCRAASKFHSPMTQVRPGSRGDPAASGAAIWLA